MKIKKALLMLGLSLVLLAGLILLSQSITKSVYSRYKFQNPTQTLPLPSSPQQGDPTPPTPASDRFYDGEGNSYTLQDFQDRPLVVSLWSVNKGRSTQNLEFLEDAYRQYGDHIHFVVIHVTKENATQEDAAARLAKEDCTFPVYYDPDGAFLNQYEKNTVPLTLYFQRGLDAIAYSDEPLNKNLLQNGIKAILPQ